MLIAEVETAQEATKVRSLRLLIDLKLTRAQSQSDPAKDQVAPKGVSALPVAPVITVSTDTPRSS